MIKINPKTQLLKKTLRLQTPPPLLKATAGHSKSPPL